MNVDKYARSVTLNCPTCGGTSFESESNESLEVTCIGCARTLTRDELRRENEENIQEHLNEMKKDVMKDVAGDLRKQLQKAFKCSKGFRLK
ncbi:hypothetical protein ACIF81_07360 [Pseudomonas juntendi]|uniref:ECs_2282 family putative zinc-binding protein n=1 Tax=Pseudomonas juntendi TaxID=2666183 RepID=UPI0018D9285F|nr:hypothetical protein [Pseudomonas juntendi]MBH3372437.1 hypothetical protein [Pseudomonas juntendi]